MATIEHRLALSQGTRVQDFQFHRVLGHGGFGITYLGWNVTLDIPVAIKEYLPADLAMREQDMSVLPKSAGDEEDFHWGLDRFLDEARVMARFRHPNIVQVQHFFQAHGTAYIVMEYVEGETLSDLLKRRGTLMETELNNILLPLLVGLIEVHEAGILHRDIKPGNILLRAADSSPVLVDFGAARQVMGARSRSVTSVLTPGYAPIEQYSSRGHQGPWTDIYALGGVCYQALTGKVPDEAMDRIRQDPMLPVTEAGKGMATDAFLSAIDWALRVEEADRPEDIRFWRAALLGEETVPEPVSMEQSASQPEKQDRPSKIAMSGYSKLPRWLLALGLVLLVGIGTWWGWQAYSYLFGNSQGDITGVMESEEKQPESAHAVNQDEVARLLAAAEMDLKARRLTSPAGNNAWERYQEVLKLDSSNPEAVAGMERVIESYMELFGTALEQEDFEQADTYLYRIHALHPDSPILLAGKQRLALARLERTDRLAKQGRQRQVARLAELERQRIAQAIEKHWEDFEKSIRAEDLDKAANILARVRELNPEEQELAAGEQRLAETNQARSKRLEKHERRLVAVLKKLTEDMVEIPSGTFRMGDLSGDGLDNERPVHSVTLPAFRMSKYEVTFKPMGHLCGGRGLVRIIRRMITAGAGATGRSSMSPGMIFRDLLYG